MDPSQWEVVVVFCEQFDNVLHTSDEKLEQKPDIFFPSLYTSIHFLSVGDRLHLDLLQVSLLVIVIQLNSPSQEVVVLSLTEHHATVGHVVILSILLHAVVLKVHAELDSHLPFPQVLSAAMYPLQSALHIPALPLLSPSSQVSLLSLTPFPQTEVLQSAGHESDVSIYDFRAALMPNDLPISLRMRQFTSFAGVVMVPSQRVVVLVLCEHKPRFANVLHNSEKLGHSPDVFLLSLYTSTHLLSDVRLHENLLQASLLLIAVQLNSPTQVDVVFSLVEHHATVGHVVMLLILLHSVVVKVHAEIDSHFPFPQVLSAAMYPVQPVLHIPALPLLSPLSQISTHSILPFPQGFGISPSQVLLQYHTFPLSVPSSQISVPSFTPFPHSAGASQVAPLIYFFTVES
jgi:hypothetical protein